MSKLINSKRIDALEKRAKVLEKNSKELLSDIKEMKNLTSEAKPKKPAKSKAGSKKE